MRRVLVILNDWPWKMTGGSNYHTLKVIQYWVQYWNNTAVDVLMPRLGYTYAKRQLNLKGEIIVTDSFFERDPSTSFGRAVLNCSRILRILLSPPRRRYDVIVASSHYLTDVLPAAFLRWKNPSSKLVAYHHSGASEPTLDMSSLRTLNDAISVPLLRRYATLIFAINEPVRDYLFVQHIDRSKVLITNNGIDEIARSVGSEPRVFEACFVGRLEKGKGVFDLVAIWKAVCAELPHAKLVIIGDGHVKDQLIKLIEKEHLQENIAVCGFVDEEKKFEILRKSKLLLLPSYIDTWGIVIAEALSNGVPAVVYDLPGFRAIWGTNVVFVRQSDTSSFARAVVQLLNEQQLRSELAKKGLRRVRGFLWREVSKYEADAIESAH